MTTGASPDVKTARQDSPDKPATLPPLSVGRVVCVLIQHGDSQPEVRPAEVRAVHGKDCANLVIGLDGLNDLRQPGVLLPGHAAPFGDGLHAWATSVKLHTEEEARRLWAETPGASVCFWPPRV